MSEKSSVEDSAECFPGQIHGIFRLVPCPVKSNEMVTVHPGLRIYCADRTKTYRQKASGPSLHDKASAAIGMAGCRNSSAEGRTVTRFPQKAAMEICPSFRKRCGRVQMAA